MDYPQIDALAGGGVFQSLKNSVERSNAGHNARKDLRESDNRQSLVDDHLSKVLDVNRLQDAMKKTGDAKYIKEYELENYVSMKYVNYGLLMIAQTEVESELKRNPSSEGLIAESKYFSDSNEKDAHRMKTQVFFEVPTLANPGLGEMNPQTDPEVLRSRESLDQAMSAWRDEVESLEAECQRIKVFGDAQRIRVRRLEAMYLDCVILKDGYKGRYNSDNVSRSLASFDRARDELEAGQREAVDTVARAVENIAELRTKIAVAQTEFDMAGANVFRRRYRVQLAEGKDRKDASKYLQYQRYKNIVIGEMIHSAISFLLNWAKMSKSPEANQRAVVEWNRQFPTDDATTFLLEHGQFDQASWAVTDASTLAHMQKAYPAMCLELEQLRLKSRREERVAKGDTWHPDYPGIANVTLRPNSFAPHPPPMENWRPPPSHRVRKRLNDARTYSNSLSRNDTDDALDVSAALQEYMTESQAPAGAPRAEDDAHDNSVGLDTFKFPILDAPSLEHAASYSDDSYVSDDSDGSGGDTIFALHQGGGGAGKSGGACVLLAGIVFIASLVPR